MGWPCPLTPVNGWYGCGCGREGKAWKAHCSIRAHIQASGLTKMPLAAGLKHRSAAMLMRTHTHLWRRL